MQNQPMTVDQAHTVKGINLAAAAAVIVGSMVLIGWAFDIAALKSILPGWFPMKANFAVALILLGIALFLITRLPETFNPQRTVLLSRLARFCVLLVGLIGLLTLCEYIFGWNLGIDQWLFREPVGAVGTSHPGRMAQEAALSLVLLATALWITGSSYKTRWTVLASGSLGLLVATFGLVAILSHLTPSFGAYGWLGYSIMAMHAAMMLVILGVAVIAISWQPDILLWSLSRRTTATFACGMVVLVFIGFNTSRSQFWMKETNRQIEYSEAVLSEIRNLLIEVVSTQSHARGYVITGDEEFKAGYLEAKASSHAKLDELHKLVVGHLHQEQQFAQIEARVDEGLQWFQQVVDAREAGMTEAARNKRVHHGEALLDSLGETFDQIESEHSQHIQKMKLDAENVSRLSYFTIFTGTLVSLLIFFSVIFRLNFSVNTRKLAEEKLRRSSQLYALLSECNQSIVHCANEGELFAQICRGAVQFGGFKMVWIGLIDEASKQVKTVSSSGNGEEYLKDLQISTDVGSIFSRGPTGTAIHENQPFWCQDFQHDLLTAPWHERGVRFGWTSSASLPLHRNGIVIGAFTLYSDEKDAFGEDARKLLIEMTDDISFALDNFDRDAERKRAIKLLEKNEQHFRAVTQSANDAIITAASTGNIVVWNAAARRLFGYAEAEIIGQPLTVLIPERFRSLHNAGLARVVAGGVPHIIGKTVEVAGLRKDGSEFPLELSLATWEATEGLFFTAIIRDISERKLGEDSLVKQLDELKRWHEATLKTGLRNIEIKREVNELLGQTGQPPRYNIPE